MRVWKRKLQEAAAGDSALKDLLAGRERRAGLLMAALVLAAAVLFGHSGRMREAASSGVKSRNPATVIIDAGHGGCR